MSKPTHYPLTADEFLWLNANLKDAELRVYLYLMTLNPFRNSVMEIDTAQIAEQLGLTRRTIQRAIKRLQELELIEIEITRFKYKKATHGASSRLGSSDTRIANDDTRIANDDTRIASDDTRIANNDTRIATAPVKPLPDKGSSTPQIYQIYSDLIISLSDQEREKFLEFGLKKARELPKPPTLPQKWVEQNCQELYEQFKKTHQGEKSVASQKWENHPRREEWLEEMRTKGTGAFIGLAPEQERSERRKFREWAKVNNLIWGGNS
jgi:DNA-binding transcriptional ArsR family regulator